MYLCNLDHVPATIQEKYLPLSATEIVYAYTPMMRWENEFPLLFHPLFADDIAVAPPADYGTGGGLYALAENGITALRVLYDFIQTHQSTLLDDPTAFQVAREKLFRYLDERMKQRFFRLAPWGEAVDDALPVDGHLSEAVVLKGSIEANNAIIVRAIAANDPSLLNECPFLGERTFRQYLNERVYDYGWALIRSSVNPFILDVFSENGLKGMKDTLGEVIVPAEYDTIGEFFMTEALAVVSKQGKWGYMNRRGVEVVPCVYDRADDFEYAYGTVTLDGKFGVVDQNGQTIIPTVYDDGHLLDHDLFAVKQGDEWAILDASGEVLLPFQPAGDIIAIRDTEGRSYFQVEKEHGEKLFFTHRMKPLPVEVTDKVTVAEEYYIVTRGETTALLDAGGETLLPFAQQRFHWMHELSAFAVTVARKTGLYAPKHGWLTDTVYSNIASLYTPEHSERYAVVYHGMKAGLLAVKEQPHWVLPVAYSRCCYLKKGFIGYSTAETSWGIVRADGTIVTDTIFEYLDGKMGNIPDGVAIGLKDGEMVTIAEDGTTTPMSPQAVVAALEGVTNIALLKVLRAAKKAIAPHQEQQNPNKS
ncbi:WG repeat-containing protein [Chitinophaga varians]|uniref:WG repeat-containing protein n=1 Tax=Chitinophaga varians TaxID=2202339 RepID=UPI00165F5BB1|nr:WG repeat-containing protein [Chitinophaga varians]MBC9913486.1 WG repeat-containing protein [Chitinophaga varians]